MVETSSFGVVGDGVADDTRALQAALDAVAGRGGDVVLGPGRFRITDTLRLSGSEVTVRGAGIDRTVISACWGDEHDRVALLVLAMDASGTVDRLHDVTLHDFAIEGAGRFTPNGHHLAIGSVDGLVVHDIRSSLANCMGIAVGGVTAARISACTVDRAAADGIHATHDSVDVTIEDNSVSDTGDDGIGLGWEGPVREVRVARNRIQRTGSRGVAVLGPAFDIEVDDNDIDSTWLAGVTVDCWNGPVRGVDITANRIREAGTYAGSARARGQGVGGGVVVVTGSDGAEHHRIDGIRICGNDFEQVRNAFVVVGPVNGPTTTHTVTGLEVRGNVGRGIQDVGGLGRAPGGLGGESRTIERLGTGTIHVVGAEGASISDNDLR